MELFEQIRREYEHGVGTIKGVARKLGVHRRMVREAIANAVPPARKMPVRERPKLGPAMEFIDGILEADRKRRANSATRRTGSGCDCGRSCLRSRWPSARCGNMCASAP